MQLLLHHPHIHHNHDASSYHTSYTAPFRQTLPPPHSLSATPSIPTHSIYHHHRNAILLSCVVGVFSIKFKSVFDHGIECDVSSWLRVIGKSVEPRRWAAAACSTRRPGHDAVQRSSVHVKMNSLRDTSTLPTPLYTHTLVFVKSQLRPLPLISSAPLVLIGLHTHFTTHAILHPTPILITTIAIPVVYLPFILYTIHVRNMFYIYENNVLCVMYAPANMHSWRIVRSSGWSNRIWSHKCSLREKIGPWRVDEDTRSQACLRTGATDSSLDTS